MGSIVSQHASQNSTSAECDNQEIAPPPPPLMVSSSTQTTPVLAPLRGAAPTTTTTTKNNNNVSNTSMTDTSAHDSNDAKQQSSDDKLMSCVLAPPSDTTAAATTTLAPLGRQSSLSIVDSIAMQPATPPPLSTVVITVPFPPPINQQQQQQSMEAVMQNNNNNTYTAVVGSQQLAVPTVYMHSLLSTSPVPSQQTHISPFRLFAAPRSPRVRSSASSSSPRNTDNTSIEAPLPIAGRRFSLVALAPGSSLSSAPIAASWGEGGSSSTLTQHTGAGTVASDDVAGTVLPSILVMENDEIESFKGDGDTMLSVSPTSGSAGVANQNNGAPQIHLPNTSVHSVSEESYQQPVRMERHSAAVLFAANGTRWFANPNGVPAFPRVLSGSVDEPQEQLSFVLDPPRRQSSDMGTQNSSSATTTSATTETQLPSAANSAQVPFYRRRVSFVQAGSPFHGGGGAAQDGEVLSPIANGPERPMPLQGFSLVGRTLDPNFANSSSRKEASVFDYESLRNSYATTADKSPSAAAVGGYALRGSNTSFMGSCVLYGSLGNASVADCKEGEAENHEGAEEEAVEEDRLTEEKEPRVAAAAVSS